MFNRSGEKQMTILKFEIRKLETNTKSVSHISIISFKIGLISAGSKSRNFCKSIPVIVATAEHHQVRVHYHQKFILL